jgi:polysaccharide export outer membrane protein
VGLWGCAAPLNSGTPGGSSEIGSAPESIQPGHTLAQGIGQTGAASAVPPVTEGYKLGPLDIIDITVFNVPELSKTVQVAQTGTVNLPLVGEVPAAGKTTQEFERDLAARLGARYLQNPQVTVLVKEYNSQKVTVTGAVKKPGVYSINARTSLLQIVAMAGDFESVSDSTVLVLRTSGGKRMAAKFDVDAIQSGRAQDPPVQAGDMVIAGTSAIKSGFNYILRAVPIAGLWAVL